MSRHEDHEVRQIYVTDPRLHPKKFTVYKVTYLRFPKQDPENGVHVVVWRRFNDFKRLFRDLHRLHYALCRPARFPETLKQLCKVKVFGRFDVGVIEERRQAALELLEFAVTQTHLYSSDIWNAFFEGAEVVVKEDELRNITDAPLIPTPISAASAQITEAVLPIAQPRPLSPPPPTVFDPSAVQSGDVAILERLRTKVLHREFVITEPGDTDYFCAPGIPSSLTAPASIAVPCPQFVVDSLSEGVLARSFSHDDLAAGVVGNDQIAASFSSLSLPQLGDTNVYSSSHREVLGGTWEHPLGSTEDFCSQEDQGATSEADSLTSDGLDSLENPTTKTLESFSSLSLHPWRDQIGAAYITQDPVKKPAPQRPRREAPKKDEALFNWDVRVGGPEGANYIVEAANQITKAQDFEAVEEFQSAFDCYRAAVGILLSGVQSDTNFARRDAVRRKTAQYLTRAEDIYRLFLCDEEQEPDRWAKTTMASQESRDARSQAKKSKAKEVELEDDRRGDVDELNQFQVVGVLDANVVLVRPEIEERNRLESLNPGETYVLKMVRKSNSTLSLGFGRLPRNVGFMVQMIRYYELRHAYCLLLEYAVGGRLYAFLAPFFPSSGPAKELGLDDSKLSTPISLKDGDEVRANAYSGQNLLGGSKTITESSLDVLSAAGAFDLQKSKSMDSHENHANGSFDFAAQRDPIRKIDSFEEVNFDREESKLSLELDSRDEIYRERPAQPDTNSRFDDEGVSLQQYQLHSVPPQHHFHPPPPPPPSELIVAGGGDSRLQRSFLSKETEEGFFEFADASDAVSAGGAKNGLDVSGEEFGRLPPEGASNHRTNCFIDEIFNASDPYPFNSDPYSSDLAGKGQIAEDQNTTRCPSGSCLRKPSDFANQAFYPPEVSPPASSPQDAPIPYTPTIQDFDQSMVPRGYYSPSSLESTEIICTSSTSHTYQGPGSYGVLNRTPCNCHSCSSQSMERTQYEMEHYRNVQLRAAQCGCEMCVKGFQGDIRPLPYPMPQTTLPRSESLVPEYFEGDPSVMVNSTSNHSIKIQMTGDTMQVEITSPDENASKSDFEQVFKELDDAMSEFKSHIPEACVRNWGAEIVLAVDELHQHQIKLKDLNPRNLLLDEKGHILLTYFSRLPDQDDYIDEEAKEDLFVAPEVMDASDKVEFSCDWWSVGVILYEMLVGEPLRKFCPQGFSSHTQLIFPDHVSEEGASILRDLLKFHPRERLGSGQGGFADIKSHPFFDGINWPVSL